jgi:predicted nucleotidyltransferase
MNKNEVLSSLETLKHNLEENYGVTKIDLFGSYSRNKETKFSMFKYLRLNKCSRII